MTCALDLIAVRRIRGRSFQSFQLILSELRVRDGRGRIHATKSHHHLYRRTNVILLQESNYHALTTQPCSYDTPPPPNTHKVGPYPTSAKWRGCARQSTLAPPHPASVTAVRQRSPSPCFVCPRRPHPKPTHRRHLNPRSCDCAEPPNARATMRSLPQIVLPSLLACASVATASDMIAPNRIKVQLFAAPAFFSEVSVDAYDGQCLSLDNNL
jgi:hypothetical protein